MIRHTTTRWMLGALLGCAVLISAGAVLTRAAAPEPAFVPKDICPGTCSSSPRNLAVGDNLLFFEARTEATGMYTPWVSDGTLTGTITNTLGPNGSAISPPVNIAGTWYFAADDGTFGTELWSRPAAGGTPTLIRNIAVSNRSSKPRDLTDVAGTLLFVADDGIVGEELWRSDGTDAGTTLVKDINPTKQSSNGDSSNISPERFVIGNRLLFAADDGSSGTELWASDGSPTGTLRLKDINSGTGDSIDTRGFVSAGNRVFFRAKQDNGKVGLWTSDGTPGGTVMLKERSGSTAASKFTALAAGNDRAFFIIATGTEMKPMRELWTSDGTTGGTKLVTALEDYPTQSFVVVNGTLFFDNNAAATGVESWKSDGTDAGTGIVKDINPGNGNGSPLYATNIAGKLIFSASDGIHGNEVWQSDGTADGTTLLADVAPGAENNTAFDSNPSLFALAGKFMFFVATGTSGTVGRELWAIPRYVITGEPPPEPTAMPSEPTVVPGEPTAEPTVVPGEPTPEPTAVPGEPTPEPAPEPDSYTRFLPLVQGR